MHTPNCPAYFDGGFHPVPPRQARVSPERAKAMQQSVNEIEVVDGPPAATPSLPAARSEEAGQPVAVQITVQLVVPESHELVSRGS